MRPRKSRGQNFLVQEAVARRIVDAARLAAGDSVVEVGPGLGILTGLIVSHPLAHLALIELDGQLAARLEAQYSPDPRIAVVHEDFLTVDFANFARSGQLIVIGNLPFNVATAILERLCTFQKDVARMVLMFQREVAERIRAQPDTSSYGALSVFTALYWDIVDHFRVAAGSFHPRPKVEAEVLTFAPRAASLFTASEETSILNTVRASFSAPRKTLRNSLAGGLGIPPELAEDALLRSGTDPLRRPGTLAAADFVRLAHALRAPLTSTGAPDA